jgi:hypothetical protein
MRLRAAAWAVCAAWWVTCQASIERRWNNRLAYRSVNDSRLTVAWPKDGDIMTHTLNTCVFFGQDDDPVDWSPIERNANAMRFRSRRRMHCVESDMASMCGLSPQAHFCLSIPWAHQLKLNAYVLEAATTSAELALKVARATHSGNTAERSSIDSLIPADERASAWTVIYSKTFSVTRANTRSFCSFESGPCMSPAEERPHCADPRTFRFMVYPLEEAERFARSYTDATFNWTLTHSPMGSWMRILLRHPLRTTDPAQACVKIPAVDTLCASNTCLSTPDGLSSFLRALPGWNMGVDSVLFHYGDHWPNFDPGFAILAKSSFGNEWNTTAAFEAGTLHGLSKIPSDLQIPNFIPAQRGFDIEMPLTFFRCNLDMFSHFYHKPWMPSAAEMASPCSDAAKRDVLLSFAGAAYQFDSTIHPSSARYLMAKATALHTQFDRSDPPQAPDGSCPLLPAKMVWFRSFCASEVAKDCLGTRTIFRTADLAECVEWRREYVEDQARFGDNPFTLQLPRSRFALIAPGEGCHSYRLLEVLLAGVVPVITKGHVLPFSDLIDWSSMAVLADVSSVADATAFLKLLESIPVEQWASMQRNGARVYQHLLSSPQRHFDTALIILMRRFGAGPTELTTEEVQLLNRQSWAAFINWDALPIGPEAVFERPGIEVDSVNPVFAWAASEAVVTAVTQMRLDRAQAITWGPSTRLEGPLLSRPSRLLQDPAGIFSALVGPKCATVSLYSDVLSRLVKLPGDPEATPTPERPFPIGVQGLSQRLLRLLLECLPTVSERMRYPAASSATLLVTADSLMRVGAQRQALDAITLSVVYGASQVSAPDADPVEHFSALVEALSRVRSVTLELLLQAAASFQTGPRSCWDRSSSMGLAFPRVPGPMLLFDREEHVLDISSLVPRQTLCDGSGALRGIVAQSAARFRQRQSTFVPLYGPGSEVLPDAPPTFAIVTLCAYDASVTPLAELSFANRRAYCARHGYECILESDRNDQGSPAAWGKVQYMLKHLHRAPWVAWVDCDTFFTNFSLPLEAVLAQAGVDPHASDGPVMVLSEDGAALNTGVFFLRRSDTARRILEWVWDARLPEKGGFESHSWWEQAAMIELLAMGTDDGWTLEPGAVASVPQAMINSYPDALARQLVLGERPMHAIWQPGDLAVSFSGCNFMFRNQTFCNEWFQQFFSSAEEARRDDWVRLSRQ